MEETKRIITTMTTAPMPAHCQDIKPAMSSLQDIKPAMSSLQHTNGVNDDDETRIKEFMNWHFARVKKGRRDIPVKELRTIIPVFILRTFAMKEDQPSQKKVKGLWDKPPSGWDTAVPFLDPNNKGDKGKPKKEVLMQMFEYLVKVYQRANNTAWDLTKGPIQESEMLTEYNDGGRPVEVADDADSYDWNPLEDCNQRITLKLHSMQGERCLSTDDIGVLNVAKDVLFRLFGQLGKKESLTYAHDFELTLDIVKVTKGLPQEHKQKWREFEGEVNKLNTASCPQTMEKLQLLSDESFKELGISTQHNPLVSGQTDDFSNVLSVRENLEELMFLGSDAVGKKVTENEAKFAIADAVVSEDKTGELMDSSLGFSLEDSIFLRMFSEDNNEDVLDVSPVPDITDYFKEIDWSETLGNLEMPHDDNLIQDGGESCEDVHTPSLDHCVPPVGDTNTGDIGNNDISIHQRERHDSIDNDHSYIRKDEMTSILSPTSNVCNQVERLRISSPSWDPEPVKIGTKRGYTDAGNDLGPKHRRTEDMDIDAYDGDGGDSFNLGGAILTLADAI